LATLPPFFWKNRVRTLDGAGEQTSKEKIAQPLRAVVFFEDESEDATRGICVRIISTDSGGTYRDKFDNTVVVGNILMNVHG